MSIELLAIVIIGGVFAGFVTTLAGLGSVLTLYILMEIVGMDGDVANGTNRLGIMAMALIAVPTFYKGGHLNLRKSWPIVTALVIGAVPGVFLAINIDNEAFKKVFRYLLIAMLMIVLIDPKKWIRDTDESHKMSYWVLPILVVMGFYAGFIQVGTSVLLVVFLAIVGKYSLVDASGIKLTAFALYTAVCIAVFAYNGKIAWQYGGILAIGEGIGAYIAARVATTYPKANSIVRYLLITVLILAIVQSFKLYEFILPAT
jgi:uncharacterized membrane protein YfcA